MSLTPSLSCWASGTVALKLSPLQLLHPLQRCHAQQAEELASPVFAGQALLQLQPLTRMMATTATTCSLALLLLLRLAMIVMKTITLMMIMMTTFSLDRRRRSGRFQARCSSSAVTVEGLQQVQALRPGAGAPSALAAAQLAAEQCRW